MRNLKIKTRHGEIKTPTFLPDATYGAISTLSFKDSKAAGVEELVTTTLHLEQKLGSDYIADYGGLHKFFGWDRPILTDSGGFQVFSLIHRRGNKLNKITDKGAQFKDPVTGSLFELSPEKSLQIQAKLDSDIRVVLDEPLGLENTPEKNLESVERTTAWAARSRKEFNSNEHNDGVLLGAVVQGGGDRELRRRSANELIELGFDMYNYGGFPIKPDGSLDQELSEYLANLLPKNKPRYAMGIGTPDDIRSLADMGWDLFDCVLPTRNARHGYLYVPKGEGDADFGSYSVVHIKSERYKLDENPISSLAKNHPELAGISRAYLRHLVRLREPAGLRLATISNLFFYSELMRELRGEL